MTDLGPLFETPVSRVLAAAPAAVKTVLDRYTNEPLLESDQIAEQLTAYVQEIEKLSQEIEFFDSDTAKRVAARCGKLIDTLRTDSNSDHRRLVQSAVRYFIEDDDAESDSMSPIGFDDDALVVDLVVEELRRDGITIE